jgi:hypothetical protein
LLVFVVGALFVSTLGEQFLSLFGVGLRWSVPERYRFDLVLAAIAVVSLFVWRAAAFGAELALAVPLFALGLLFVGVLARTSDWLVVRWIGLGILAAWSHGSALIGVVAGGLCWRRPHLARTLSLVLLLAACWSALRLTVFDVRSCTHRVELADRRIACDSIYATPTGCDLVVEVWREWPLCLGCRLGRRIDRFERYGWYGNLQVQDGAAVLLSPEEPHEVIGGPWR